jgi:hypothetical protein
VSIIAIVVFLVAGGYWMTRVLPRSAPCVVIAFGTVLLILSLERTVSAHARVPSARTVPAEYPVARVYSDRAGDASLLVWNGRLYWIVPAAPPAHRESVPHHPAKPLTY